MRKSLWRRDRNTLVKAKAPALGPAGSGEFTAMGGPGAE